MFRGISMGPSLHLSHLFYADDVVFMGHWSDSNIDTIVQVLECFYRALGLRINMNKSKLIGILVVNVIVDQAARMESIRCHFFNGVDHNGKKPKVLASKEKGGLGINKEDGKLGKNVNHSHPSIWLDIVREMEQLMNLGTDLISFIHKKMGNGADTSLWGDVWRDDEFSASMEGDDLVDMRDRWVWSLDGSGEFTAASVQRLIDERWLLEVLTKTRWINVVPIKVNVHA
ncbi:hypothetical protein Tco_0540262 [Tanacetum coccineum]